MTTSPVMCVGALGFPWRTLDPFLFCVHHLDFYPAGDPAQGVPAQALMGRPLGNDFMAKDGWRMYHGHQVPGFPRHPHRGFETITIVRQGFVDHADSMGATARFGPGDVQWMTAGRGVEHCEMFPLRDPRGPNTAELFQIWLDLPAKSKMVAPHFSMLWGHDIPKFRSVDVNGRKTDITVVAGSVNGLSGPKPSPDSWAAAPHADLAILTLRMEAGAHWTLPAAPSGVNRALYAFSNTSVQVADCKLAGSAWVQLCAGANVDIVNLGAAVAEFLVLQGRPLGEAVVQYGPFVMNTQTEIQQAMADYHQGLFGHWPWPSDAPVHARDQDRFARHADGRHEAPTVSSGEAEAVQG